MRALATTGPPASFWISGLFCIRSFLVALRRCYARHRITSVDLVELDCKVLPDDSSSGDLGHRQFKDGVHVHGLFLEGCCWDPKLLRLAELTMPWQMVRCPPLLLLPCEPGGTTKGPSFRSPLYVVPIHQLQGRRKPSPCNLVCHLPLPSSECLHLWHMRQVALLTQVDK